MAFDAPRKTLDEIRREIDAEFAGRPTADGAAADAGAERSAPLRDDVGEDVRLEDLRRHRGSPRTRRGSYILAGVIGCVVGQLALFGSVIATRYWFRSVHAVADAPPAPVAATPASRSVPQPPTATPPSHAADVARTPEPTPSVAVASSSPAAAAPELPETPVPPLTISPPPPSVAEPSMRATASQRRTASTARVAVSAPTPELRARVADFDNWAKSQAEVRAALGEWLALSGRRGADALASEAVVILGADGQTAKTHVPVRSRSGVMTIGEQRWERTAKGWSIVAEREEIRQR